MKTLRDMSVRECTWAQPSKRKRTYEMRCGDEVSASLRFVQKHGNVAVASTADGEWELHKSGLLRPQVIIRQPDLNLQVAIFHCRWNGGGTLSFRDGGTYTWNNTNRLHTAWAWTDRVKQPLLHFKKRTMTIEPAGALLPNIALLACLSWYLNIVNNDDNDGAVGAIVAVTA